MAAFGGLTVLDIGKGGEVTVRRVPMSTSAVAEFVSNTHIYFTGTERDAKEVLADQNQAMQAKAAPSHARVADSLHAIKDLGYRILEAVEAGNFDRWGLLLDEHWQKKKRLSDKISFGRIDEIYAEAVASHHVLGGKVIGAGGGGFLMLYCHRNHQGLERHMASLGMPRLHYTIEPEGTKVITQAGPGFMSRRGGV
jgi:D-glycero-alpha-D-manno-heptose-7-phosphate kinase